MNTGISHDWAEETIEAKARWFQTLSYAERMEMLCAFAELALAVNPGIADKRDDERTRKGVRILSKA